MRMSGAAKRMLLVVGISLPVLVAGSAAYYRSPAFLPFAYGALLGTAMNAAKIFLLDRTVKKVTEMDADKAGNYVRLRHFLNFLLTGLALVTAAVVPFINLWGTVAEVLVYQAAVYSLKGLNDNKGQSKNTGKGGG